MSWLRTMFGTIQEILKEATLKKFWLGVLERTLFLLLISFAVLWFSKETIVTGVGTASTMLVASLGILLSTGLIIGVTTLGLLWMFKRIAKDRGMEVEDIVFALYELRWSFNRVAYSKEFKADFEETKRIRGQIPVERIEHWGDL